MSTQEWDGNEIGGATGWPFERVCPVCGRVFCSTMLVETWPFREKDSLICSWGCLRRREKENEKKREAAEMAQRAKRLTPAQKEGIVRRAVLRGLTNDDIIRETGISRQLVNYYRKKVEEAMIANER